jgi:hypothetical protein
MNTDLIFPLIAGAAFAVLLAVWKTGRAVAVAALTHPFRRNLIYVDANGNPHIVVASSNGFKPQAAQQTAQAANATQTGDNREQEEPYILAKSRH